MAPVTGQPNPITSLLPLIIILIPVVIVCNKLAKEKGKNVTLWTILACIPIINFVSIFYLVGTTNKYLEEKIDRLLSQLEQKEKI